MNIIKLELSKLKECKHTYLKEAFGFPDYYGCNLDALYDCLGDLPKTCVLLTRDGLPDAFCEDVLQVLTDSRKINLILKTAAY